jgi:hypothetical protein
MLQETSEVSYNVTSPSDDDGADSENDTVFHDAADDDLVFVDLDLINNGQDTEVEMAGNLDSSSGNDSDSDCSSSSPEEEEDPSKIEIVNRAPLDDAPTPRQTHRQDPSSSSSIEYSHKLNQRPDLSSRNSSASSLHLSANLVVRRRTVLPSPVCGDEFSIFSMLKKNVGKVSERIAFHSAISQC